MKKFQNTLIGAAVALVSLQSVAAPLSGYDARSLAMGGTGTASGAIGNASYYNPALLAAHREGEDFGFALSGGVIARDQDDVIGSIELLQEPDATLGIAGLNRFEQFSNAADAYSLAVDAAIPGLTLDPDETVMVAELHTAVASQEADLQNSAQSVVDALGDLNNKPIELGAVFGLNIAIPSQYLGLAVFAGGRAEFSGSVSFDPNGDGTSDLSLITDTVNTITTATTIADLDAIADPFAGGAALETEFNTAIAVIGESGVSAAFKIAGIAIGMTQKTVTIEVFEDSQAIDAANTSTDTSNTSESFSDSNMDIGVAFEIADIKIGMVGKNLISQEYTIAQSGNKVVIEPQYRAGFSMDSGLFTLTMDQDLTENKPVIVGSSAKATQYTSIGAEFDIALVQLRVGMRTNAADPSGNSDVITAGVGVHFLANIDVGIAANETGADVLVTAGIKW